MTVSVIARRAGPHRSAPTRPAAQRLHQRRAAGPKPRSASCRSTRAGHPLSPIQEQTLQCKRWDGAVAELLALQIKRAASHDAIINTRPPTRSRPSSNSISKCSTRLSHRAATAATQTQHLPTTHLISFVRTTLHNTLMSDGKTKKCQFSSTSINRVPPRQPRPIHGTESRTRQRIFIARSSALCGVVETIAGQRLRTRRYSGSPGLAHPFCTQRGAGRKHFG